MIEFSFPKFPNAGRRMITGAVLLTTLVLIGASALGIQAAAVQKGDQGQAQFQIDVAAALYEVRVTDKQGAPVVGLTEDDFSVSEDGKPRRIVYFNELKDRPMSVAVLLDVGSGMSRANVETGKDMIFNLIHALDREDEILIGIYTDITKDSKSEVMKRFYGTDKDVDFLSPLTSDRIKLLRAIENITVGERPGRTGVVGRTIVPPGSEGPAAALGIDFSASKSVTGLAVDEALLRLRKASLETRAVLVISTGFSNLGEGTLDHLEDAEASFFGVGFSDKLGNLLDLGSDRSARKDLVRSTGGAEFSAKTIAGKIDRVRAALEHSYLIAFEPGASGTSERSDVVFEVRGRTDIQITAGKRSTKEAGRWWQGQ